MREDFTIPVSEQQILTARTNFLCLSIQSAHLKLHSFLYEGGKEKELASEIKSFKDLTALRIKELQHLRTVIEKYSEPDSASYKLLQHLETKIIELDAKHDQFIQEVEEEKYGKASNLSAELHAEWHTLHAQVLDAESALLMHTQKQSSEIEEFSNIIKQQAQIKMYFILIAGFGLTFAVLLWFDFLVLKSLIKDRAKKNKNTNQRKRIAKMLLVSGIILLLFVPLWLLYLAPELTKLPEDFKYNALVFSQDNFYDEEKQQFGGEMVSNTKHSFRAVDKQNGVILVQNLFTVLKPDGEIIFSVERRYGIDAKSRKHVAGYGDKNREGYLFAPPNLKKGQNFTYWHVNYDAPAYMEYQGEDNIAGLTVYRYETNYHADQTFDLKRAGKALGGKGIDLDINLQLWVEPVTGTKIKYEDLTTAYFYNLSTGERLHPWNRFHNQYDQISILKQVEIVKYEKLKRVLIEQVVTTILAMIVIGLLLYASVIEKRSD